MSHEIQTEKYTYIFFEGGAEGDYLVKYNELDGNGISE